MLQYVNEENTVTVLRYQHKGGGSRRDETTRVVYRCHVIE